MNNTVFEKTLENARKHRNMEHVTIKKIRNYLVWEPTYQTPKFITKNVLAIEMRITETFMNNRAFLGLSILSLSKTVMYEFCKIM